MDQKIKVQVVERLRKHVTSYRKKKMAGALENRTHLLTLVLEDIYDSHNASAIVRSCEAFGVQTLHVVENRNFFELKKAVTRGSAKWIDIHRYNKKNHDNTRECLNNLRKKGYRIVAATPHRAARILSELSPGPGLALLFGSERDGLSETALHLADERIMVPMFGFTESFNLSVSAAICIYDLIGKMHSGNHPWRLNETERIDLEYRWLKKSIRHSDKLEMKYLNDLGIRD